MTGWRGRLASLALCLLLAGCGAASAASGPAASGPGDQGAVTGSGLQGLIIKPRRAAAPLALHNFTGPAPVSLSQFRGKAVLVTFVYTHCPDVCPLIVSDLAAAQRALGARARHLQILAVTVDPRRDTPSAIHGFLQVRGALGRMDYLLGSRPALRRVWKTWQVAVVTNRNQLTTGHSSIIYGITASGRLAVVYPSNVSPAQIEHDVPLLARE